MSDQKTPKAPATDPAPKKSEGIEIRLPLDSKTAFREACDTHGETASGVLRQAIDHYTNHGHFKANPPKYRSFTLIVSGMIIGGLLVGSAITTYTVKAEPENPLIASHFNRLDTSGDGALTLKEYLEGLNHLSVKKGAIVRTDAQMVIGSSIEVFVSKRADSAVRNPVHENTVVSETTEQVGISTGTSIGEKVIAAVTVAAVRAFDTNALINNLSEENPECATALIDINNAELAREFYRLDNNENNTVDISEFSHTRLLPGMQDLKVKFDKIDQDKNGSLSHEEVHTQGFFMLNAIDNLIARQSTRQQPLPKACQLAFENSKLGQEKASEQIPLHQSFSVYKWALSPPTSTHGMSEETYEQLDLNHDGKLRFDEFIRWYM